MKDQIIIPDYCVGPPAMGNGGYVAGAFAAFLETREPVEVTLRAPAPLETPLDVVRETGARIFNQGQLIAEVCDTTLDLEVPSPPEWKEAEQVRPESYSFGDRDNPLFPGRKGYHPICFCCGVENDKGLGVFAAPVLNNAQVAAVWKTKAEWGNDSGNLPETYIWTALDCPGQFAYFAAGVRTGLLGRITAHILKPAKAGEEYLVTGWRIHVDGKKHFAGTALFDRKGELLARAKSVWIGTRPQV